jgi:hypothetical protein
MEDHAFVEDGSHYEISLTSRQAFASFVLLLLSLAASFAFGLLIGKGQLDERLAGAKRDSSVITEASVAPTPKIAGPVVTPAKKTHAAARPVTEDPDPPTILDEDPLLPAGKPLPKSASQAKTNWPAPLQQAVVAAPVKASGIALNPSPAKPSQPAAPAYAQLMSSVDQKAAEGLAAKLIDKGYTSAYVERGAGDKGDMFRVRVKFATEADARAAEPKLKEFSKDVWITRQ